jgi:hypothetical protein
MARSFSLNDPMVANEVVFNMADLSNQPLNSFAEPTRVSLYAAATAADIQILQFQLGDQIHAQNLRLPIASAVSMRDHMIAQGIIMPGQKVGLSYRNEGAGTPTMNAIVVLEELE